VTLMHIENMCGKGTRSIFVMTELVFPVSSEQEWMIILESRVTWPAGVAGPILRRLM
jgi:hypothetical protein